MPPTPLPSPGQLVTVRQRSFVVLEVARSTLPPELGALPEHVVRLSSVEDDGLGEELEVVWEIEPGTAVFARAALPDPAGFDDPGQLDAFLDAVIWGAISNADVRALHAPFRSGVTIEDYQLDPVVRALSMPRVNLLVADDVGLGKTIETGLVVQELTLRHRARSVLVVCPAALQVQWRDQMRDKFGLEFRIVDTELMRELRRKRGLHTNPWTHFPRLITSIDFLKRERPLRLFRETLPAEGEPAFPRRYDVLIVDEAHNVAPSGAGQYAVDSLRTAAVRTLAPHFEHRLFLTATPHNGYRESFTALLELLDDQRFHRGVDPDRAQLAAVMVRRLKSEIPPRWDGRPRFATRRLTPLEVDWTDAEREAHRLLSRYTASRLAGAQEDGEHFATEFVLKLLKKRLFSSPAAFAATLACHEAWLRGEKAKAARRGPVPTSLGVLRRMVDGVDEEYADDDAREVATTEVVDSASGLFRPLSDEEADLLGRLRAWAERAAPTRDTKAEALLRWLCDTLRPGGAWNERRVIVFTEYRATQKWLQGLLAAEGLAGERLMTLYGGMGSDEREAIKAAFQADPQVAPVRILLATDAASEGIDLQNHCSRLIHYEIPWNPNRMEQRNGRVDRHGQKDPEVQVFHFVGQGFERAAAEPGCPPGELEGDLEFLMRAALKVETIREDLGKVGPVIAAQVEEAMLGRRRTLDTLRVEREAEPVRRQLRFEQKLRERLKNLDDQLHETRRELRILPEHVEAVVEVGLRLAGQPSLMPARLPGVWPDPAGRRARCPVFHLPPLKGAWALCLEGLAHPHTRAVRPVVFDHDLSAGRDDVVLVHLNHRLVQACLRLLRAEVWAASTPQDAGRRLFRVTARLADSAALREPAVLAHGRLVVLGADNTRLHEEVIAAGGWLREGRFQRMNVGEVQAALGAALPQAAPAEAQVRFQALWPKLREPLLRSLEVRAEERTESLGKTLAERADREAADLAAILTELKRQIEREFAADGPVQMLLFTPPEREQFERNRASLQARAAAIPAEIARETTALRARYAGPSPRLFPVCVTFLLPGSAARSTTGGR